MRVRMQHAILPAVAALWFVSVALRPHVPDTVSHGDVKVTPSPSARDSDSLRILRLLDASAALLPDSVPPAAEAALAALRLADNRTSAGLLARIHNAAGQALLLMEGSDRVHDHLSQALLLAERGRVPHVRTAALCGLAVLEVRRGNRDRARTLLADAERNTLFQLDPAGSGRIHLITSGMLLDEQHYAIAYRHAMSSYTAYSAAGDADGMIRALAQQASCVRSIGISAPPDDTRPTPASLLALAQQLADSAGGLRSKVLVALETGEIIGRSGQRDSAWTCFERAHSTAQRTGDSELIAWATLDLGLNLMRRHLPDSSRRFFNEALIIYAKLQWEVKSGDVLQSIGESFGRKGDYTSAQQYFHEALACDKRSRDTTNIIRQLKQLGQSYFRSGLSDSGRIYYREAVRLAIVSGRKYYARCGYTELGGYEFARGQLKASLRAYLASWELLEDEQDFRLHAIDCLTIARVYIELKNWPKAEEFVQLARKYIKRHGAPIDRDPDQYTARIHLAKAKDTGCRLELATATAMYMRLRAASIERKDEQETVYASHNLSVCLLLGGRYLEALPLIRTALRYYEKNRDASSRARATGTLGRILYRLGYRAAAQDTLKRALDLFDQSRDIIGLREHLRGMRDEYESCGDFQQALHYYHRYEHVRDSILNAENLETINELTTQYDVIRIEKQVTELDRARALQALELQEQAAELLRQKLAVEQERKANLELSFEQERQRSLSAVQQAELHLERLARISAANEAALLHEREALSQTRIARRDQMILAIALTALLLLIIGFLLYRRTKSRQREEALRADAAEYRIQAATAEAHRIAAEQERREKEMHRSITRRLIETQEQERQRIARDLHDSLGQELVVIKNRVALAMRRSREPEILHRQLEQVTEMTAAAMNTVREIARDLRPTELDRLGITAAIRTLADHASPMLPSGLQSDIDSIDGLFTPDAEIILYRILQEAVSNLLRHSKARSAGIRLHVENGVMELTVEDDGNGLPATGVGNGNGRGLGLRSMQERAEMLDGVMTITSAPGEGTRVRVVIPVPAASPEGVRKQVEEALD